MMKGQMVRALNVLFTNKYLEKINILNKYDLFNNRYICLCNLAIKIINRKTFIILRKGIRFLQKDTILKEGIAVRIIADTVLTALILPPIPFDYLTLIISFLLRRNCISCQTFGMILDNIITSKMMIQILS
jgi:hypothetical protein